MTQDANWNKERQGDIFVYSYIVNGDVVGTIYPVPVIDSNQREWVCQFLDHKEFVRNSLKIGKRDIEFLYDQLNSGNLAIMS